MHLLGGQPAAQTDVEHGRALGGGASCGEVVASLITLRELASSFGDVVDDGERGARSLGGSVAAATGQVFDDLVREIEELQRDLIHVEAFVIEGHRERDRERERAEALARSAARERLLT